MADQGKERRKHKRYNMDIEVHFDFIYDLETKVKFELMDKKGDKPISDKYSGYSRNISVGGLCLATTKKVQQGDILHLEIYLPGSKEEPPIHMNGRVEWCKPVAPSYHERLMEDVEGRKIYEVGIRLLTVNGQSVDESIHHDPAYDVDWSIVLESIFGNYRTLMEGIFKSQRE